MFDMMSKMMDMSAIETMTVGDALEKFPQAKEVLAQYNVLEMAQSDAVKTMSIKSFADQHNIDLNEAMGKMMGMFGK
ncbi:MAG: DUF1858 domain-containing protein [Candidatus Melainabacteria bacterium]